MKTLGIIGGMGPLATADFFTKIIKATDAKSDKEHIPILINNNTNIPDRTAFILGGNINPTKEMIATAKELETGGASFLAMPCNTAHFFYEDIAKAVNIPFLHMIELTAKFISDNKTGYDNIILLATKGTYSSNIYSNIFSTYNLEVKVPTESVKEDIMTLIYQLKSGLDKIDHDKFSKLIASLESYNNSIFILGCTELPVLMSHMNAKLNFIDPTEILALECVKYAKQHN